MAEKYTKEQLNTLDKSFLVQLFLNQQEQLEKMSKDLAVMNAKMQQVLEQLALGNRARFGVSSEKLYDVNQISFMEVDGNIVFFNESEAVCNLDAPEPEELETLKKRPKGKKLQNIKNLEQEEVQHFMTDEELTEEFGPNGWKQLPDAIQYNYVFVPAKVKVEKHIIGVYSGKKDGHMVKAPHPKNLLHCELPCRVTLTAQKSR